MSNVTVSRTSGLAKSLLKRSAIMASCLFALAGCSISRINHATHEVEGDHAQAQGYLEQLQTRKPLLDSRTSLREMDALWVDTTALPLSAKSLGAPPTSLDCKLTFHPKVPVTLDEFTRIVTNLCGLPIQVTADALAMLNGINDAPSTESAQTSAGSASVSGLPPPFIGGDPQGSANRASTSALSFDDSGMIRGISWVNKPLSGLLDLVTNRLGLGWKFEDNAAVIYYTDTQVFHLYAISGKTKLETTVKSGAQKSNTSSSDYSSFSSDGSVQETGMTFESDIIADIEKTLRTMITPGLGRLSVSASTGTVAVTDRPHVLRRVGAYLGAENKRITRQVLLNVKVLSVQINDSDAAGLNWNAIYNAVNYRLGLNAGFSAIPGGASGSVGIVNPNNRWTGSELLIEALSQQGRVSTVSSPSVTTLNMKPAPILVGTQTTYLAQVTTTQVEGGGSSQQALTPGTLTTGFNMTLLPYLMQGTEMLLQYSINLSSLIDMKSAESGGNRIEMPEVDNRIFSQSVRLRSGQTLVLSGFDQTIHNARKRGIGDPSAWMLGGQGDRRLSRDVLVVLITPIITD